MGIEPTNPSLARRFIGFEDRGRHQSGTRFRGGTYTERGGEPTRRPARRVPRALATARGHVAWRSARV